MSRMYSTLGLIALAGLSATHWLRASGVTAGPVGWLPSLLAVPAVAFVLLGAWASSAARPPSRRAVAAVVWASAVGLAGWEVAQLRLPGRFVFDPADLAATAVGAGLSAAAGHVAAGRGQRRGATDAEPGTAE